MTLVRLASEIQTPQYPYPGDTATLRIYSSQNFYSSPEGVEITAGQVGSQSWAYEYTCDVNGDGNLVIPEVQLYATLGAQPTTAHYTAVFFDAAGRKRNTKLSQFYLSPYSINDSNQSAVEITVCGTVAARGIYTYRGQHNGKAYYNLDTFDDSTSNSAIVWSGSQWNLTDNTGAILYYSLDDTDFPWEATHWVADNGDSPIPAVDEYITIVSSTWQDVVNMNAAYVPNYNIVNTTLSPIQIEQLIANQIGSGTTPFANSLRCGKTFLSADPTLSTEPIAVGTNDPRWVVFTNQKYLSIDYANDLATAVSDIGSTPTQLFVSVASGAISTNVVTPTTLLLTFIDTGSLSVNSGRTVTIGLMSPAPSTQIFTGSGSVVLGVNAVPEKDLSWWAGNTSTADLTLKFNQMLTNAGRCFVPLGRWRCTNVTIPSFTVLRGAGADPDGSSGTVIQLYDTVSATCVLKANEAFRFISVRDLTISTSSSTASNGFVAQGTSPNTAAFLHIGHCAFYGSGASAPAQFLLKDIGAGSWQCEKVFLEQCSWVTPAGGTSVRIESVNSSGNITDGLFSVGANATAIDGYHLGFWNFIDCQAAGVGLSAVPYATSTNRTITQASITSGTKNLSIATGAFSQNDIGRPVVITGKLDSYITGITSASAATVHDNATATATNAAMTVKQYDASTARGASFLHVVNSHGPVNMVNCTDEGMTYFILNDASDYLYPIQLTNCAPQSWIQLNQSCTLNIVGGHLSSQTIRDGASAAARINLSGNYMDKDALPVITGGNVPVLLEPRVWGEHLGVSLTQTQFDNNEGVFEQELGLPTNFKFGNDYVTAPMLTEPVVSIGSSINTTGGPHKILAREGRLDPVTEVFDYYYDRLRDYDTGFYLFEGNQALPNRGFSFNAPTDAPVFIGAVITADEITTNGDILEVAAYKQNVRIFSDSARTVGGLNFPAIVEPATAGTRAILWNFGTFNITLLHQNGATAAANRFLCDTGANIVVAPDEKVHCVYDGTTARWRTSKWNITGVTSNGVNVISSLHFSCPDLAVTNTVEINGGAALTTSDQTGTGNIVMSVSPTLTGTPLAPTAAVNTSTTQLATTAFVGLLRSYLASTVTYNNTAALANTALSVPVAAATKYKIELTVFSINAVKSLNMDFAGTSTQTSFIGEWTSYLAAGTGQVGAQVTAAGTDYAAATMDANTTVYKFEGSVTTNAGGTFLLRGCQRTADASNTTIEAGSTLVLTKLS